MAYSVWQKFIESSATGLPVASPTVTVRNQSDLSLATIYSTAAGAALANPFTGTTEGLAKFFAAAGFYKITATSGTETAEFTYEPIGQAMGYDVGQSAWQLPTVADCDVLYNPNLNHNLTATSAPTVNDDTTLGYQPGTVWVDISTSPDTYYQCVDNTNGAAVWIMLGGDITDLITLTGVPVSSTDLGTFTGSTIGDNKTIKEALQALETNAELSTSGTYTATLTDVLNTSARDMPTPANYMRVGNTVTVFGEVDVTQTISGDWSIDITPPIASAMTNIFDAVGFINAATTTDKGVITANPLSDKISFAGNSTSIISKQWYFNFSYVIKT